MIRTALAPLGLALVALLACEGCRKGAPAPAQSAGTAPLAPPSTLTTDGAIAVSNLKAQISEAERELSDPRLHGSAEAELIGLLSLRAQFLGTLGDYGRALALAEAHVATSPKDGRAQLLHAGALASLHRFTEALAALDQAAALGAPADDVARARAGVLLAQGHAAEAVKTMVPLDARWPTLRGLGTEAMARAELGEVATSRELWGRALSTYRDVSPFSVAWYDFHAAMLEEREGHIEAAERLYGDAVSRLPAYAAAQAHLAAIEASRGKLASAEARLRAAVAGSDDPEYQGQLAALLALTGRSDEAARLREAAAGAYEKLLARHPEAFADHAARFWLEAGHDPRRALVLARRNLEVRTTPEAFELALEAARQTGDLGAQCEFATKARSLEDVRRRLDPVLRQLAGTCSSTHPGAL